MSSRLAWRIAIRDSDLDSTAKHVALTLDIYMNARGIAWPSRAALAEGTGLSVRTIERALARVSQSGYLVVVRGHGRKTNRYASRLPNSDTSDAPSGSVVATNATVVASLTTRSSDTGVARSRKKPSIEAGTDHSHDRKVKPEPRASAGAYRKHKDTPHKVEFDEAMAKLSRAWLDSL